MIGYITNLQDPGEQCPHGSPAGTAKDCACRTKRKRKSRAQLSKGRPLSFYEVVELMRTRYTTPHSHPSKSMVYWGHPMSIFYVAARGFSIVMDGAMNGLICEVVYPEGYQCRCNECVRTKTKVPRGPKRQADGTIIAKHYICYRGALGFEEMQKLRPLVVDPDGQRTYRFDVEVKTE